MCTTDVEDRLLLLSHRKEWFFFLHQKILPVLDKKKGVT